MLQESQGADASPLRSRFMARVFVAFLVLAALSAIISVAGKWWGRSIALAGHSDDTTIREVVIGNNVLAVPANMIRFETARRSGVTARLDLYARWPQMDGYSNDARDDFNHGGNTRNILFLSFDEPIMSRDMSGRFEPIAFCPGYLRGLSFHGDFAVVGLSLARNNKTFQGLALDDNLKARDAEGRCALQVIDLRSGDIVHWMRIEGIVEELYDVTVLPGVRRPMAIGLKSDEIRRTLTVAPDLDGDPTA